MIQLTEEQNHVLEEAAVGGTVILVPMAGPETGAADQEKCYNNLFNMGYLMESGLLVDSTNNFSELLNNLKLKYNHGFKVFTFTPVGRTMFTPNTNKVVN
jgi:hypothetical protein